MSSQPKLAVVDYGIGNLRSAEKALCRVGADARLTRNVADITSADGVVVPGVGAFGKCLEAVQEADLLETLTDQVHAAIDGSGPPFLGICVGLQMLYESSEESPGVAGLGVLPGEVFALAETERRPQMQWNPLALRDASHWLWDGLPAAPWLYFVHTYRAPNGPDVIAECAYGDAVVAAVSRGMMVATQFHPEKSGTMGLQVLANFTNACAAPRSLVSAKE